MAKGGRGPAKKPGSPARPAKKPGRAAKPSTAAGKKPSAKASAPVVDEDSAETASGPFRLGVIPGATPGKWIDIWNERMPRTALELVPVEVADQRRALVEGDVDAALVRLPIDKQDLHVIALYDEVPVVVTSSDSHLTAADELGLDDLAGEILITPRDDVLGVTVPGAVAPAFDPPGTTADVIATVAAGVGLVIVPMSLARLHQRKDVAFRPLRDGPLSRVALAWVADRTTPPVEAFVGIVRGRTTNSSRG